MSTGRSPYALTCLSVHRDGASTCKISQTEPVFIESGFKDDW